MATDARPRRLVLLAWMLVAGLMGSKANAVPSFARQTGMACEACHTVFPELTHFGRMFKANGYTLDNLKQVRDINNEKENMLLLSTLAPLSVMVQISQTWLNQPLPDPSGKEHSQTSTSGFPQQLSLFYAGKIAPHLGAMIQATYDSASGSISIDNTDVRFADTVLLPNDHGLIYGVSLNNNPTVEDLWNSTPAWGYPYASSNAVISPLAAAQIDGTLAQEVAGLNAYVMWNESLYGEIGVYRSAPQGATNSITGAAGPLDGVTPNVIRATAPYARIAYERQWHRNDFEIGAYGASFQLYPGGINGAPVPLTGAVNRFNDAAEDLQYQFVGERDLFSVEATHIHESMHLAASYGAGASANPADRLDVTRVTGTYYFRRKYGVAISRFLTTGSDDSGLYPEGSAPGIVTSADGRPDTRGWIGELDYLPWLNVKLSLQYVAYDSFNGSSTNYDGFGRSASANDSTYLLLWLAF